MHASIRGFGALVFAMAMASLAGAPSLASAQSGGVFDLSWHKVAGGGASRSSGGVFSLGGTFGQADDHASAGGIYRLNGGFWNGVAIRQLVDAPEAPVAAAPRFALRGFPRNPITRSGLEVSFTLPSSAPAELDLIDIGGRRVRSEPVGALGPGAHTVRFSHAATIEPGVYWLRLRQAGEQKVLKAVVLE